MADLICRWRNATPQTVVELVNSLPHKKMKNEEFRIKMQDKWDGNFFHTPYQLACQLGLYCEAEDGFYYPRFDHDINIDEAAQYLDFWVIRYYVPNPYVKKDGFTNIACPTYVIKELYDYAVNHPGCKYSDAYQYVFKESASNNDDIVRNLINKYSKILEYSKDGDLNVTEVKPDNIFCFMDRNNKKSFFDRFSEEQSKNLIDNYLDANIEERQEMFYKYMIAQGKSESTAKQHAYTNSIRKEVCEVVKSVTSKDSIFEVVEILAVKSIYNKVKQLAVDKAQNNAPSSSLANYKKFLDYLEDNSSIETTNTVNEAEDNASENNSISTIEPAPFSINTIIANIQSTGLIYAPTLIKRFAFSLMTKPFVILSGLAGSGKTQLAVAFAKAMSYDESQYRIVSVGADWTNREPLLGFPNALKKGEYVCPENGVLQLIIDAERNPERPYFLILDEMNLSYVERYFADFLSVMESHGKIALWDNPEGSADTIPASVSLPNNLFIIGTINVDETTYMFSPKVLDRANVIEFKISVDEMFGFMAKVQKVDVNLITAKTADMGKSFVELACTKDMQNDMADCDVLGEFFKQLKSVNAEFGYRSATEIFRFISTAKSNDDTQDKMETADVLDAAIVQKLLPKLHGSRKKLDPVLKELWKLCMPKDNKEIEISQAKAENAIYKMSADKIARMYNAAQDNGFTSFAEA